MRTVRRSATASLAAIVLMLTACSELPSPEPEASPIVEDVGSVAILVVDDFDAGPPTTARPTDKNMNCSYPTNTFGGRGGTLNPLPPSVSHGEVVYGELSELLKTGVPGLSIPQLTADQSNWSKLTNRSGVKDHVSSWEYHGGKVVLVGVDTAEYTVKKVTENIEQTVQVLRDDYHIQRFVLNLSFIVAPCGITPWLPTNVTAEDGAVLAAAYRILVEREDLKDLKDELDGIVAPRQPPTQEQAMELWTSTDVVRLREALPVGVLIRLFYGQFKLDAFGKYLGDAPEPEAEAFRQIYRDGSFIELFGKWEALTPRPRVIPVGAAGNGLDFDPDLDLAGLNPGLRLDFPFAPAIWNSVVSVTASPESKGDGDRASYANSGEVALEGSWTDKTTGTPYTVRGTSFAAPRLSHLEAFYLLRGGQVTCAAALPATTPPTTHIPPLGYSNVDNGSYVWLNKQLSDAIPYYCKNFWSYARLPVP